jgi:hypothetical protein
VRSPNEEERARAKDMLAPYRIAGDCYRFPQRYGWRFGGSCVCLAFGVATSVLGGMEASGYVMAAIMVLGGALGISRTLPGRCWFEIEQRGPTWCFRSVSGCWKSVHEVPADRIALAGVVEWVDTYGCRYRYVQIALVTPPFARTPPPPLGLDASGMALELVLAICRLITPGYGPQEYLIRTPLPRRRWRRRGRDSRGSARGRRGGQCARAHRTGCRRRRQVERRARLWRP